MCKTKIPLYSPIVELFFGLVALWLFSHESVNLQSLLRLIFIALLTINSITDLVSYNIYNKGLYPMVLVALFLSFLSGNVIYMFFQAFIVVVCLIIMAKLVGKFKNEKSLGEGDLYIFFCIGLLFFYEDIISIILIASISGIIFSLLLKKRSLPFVPLLQFGIMTTYLWK